MLDLLLIPLCAYLDRAQGNASETELPKILRRARRLLEAWALGSCYFYLAGFNWHSMLAGLCFCLLGRGGLVRFGQGSPQGYAVKKALGLEPTIEEVKGASGKLEFYQPESWWNKPYRSMAVWGCLIVIAPALTFCYIAPNSLLLIPASALGAPLGLWVDCWFSKRYRIDPDGWALSEWFRGGFTAAFIYGFLQLGVSTGVL